MTQTSIRARDSRSLRYAGLAAVAGAVTWLAKFAVIWVGNDSENLHGGLMVVGTLAFLVALGLEAWRTTASRSTGVRILAVVGAWLALFLVVGAVEEGLSAAIGAEDGSVLEELVLLVIGLPAIALGASAISRARRESSPDAEAT